MKKVQNTLIGAAIALASFQAAALPFAGVDARSLAMGGTGVASGSVANASTFNPALLAATRDDEDFNFSLAFGVLARDEGNMIDALDALQATNINGNDLVQQLNVDTVTFTDAVNAAIAATIIPSTDAAVQAAAADLINSGNALTTGLNNLDNKPLELGVNFGLNVTVPGETLGMSVFANSRGVAAGTVFIDPTDTAIIDQAIADATAFQLTQTDPLSAGLSSTLALTGAAVTEVGVALGTKIFGLALGVTPKMLQIDSISTIQSLDAASTSFPSTGESFSDANFDAGVAIDFGLFKIGGVVKNMIEQEYTLNTGYKIIIEPQARAGIALDYDWITLTMDQDLTVNKGVISTGVAAVDALTESQYTAIGAEFDLSLVQLRAGLRTDNTGNTEDVLTAGIGIHALVSFDLAAAVNDQGGEVVMQLGVRW